jgi:hypothetical protein
MKMARISYLQSIRVTIDDDGFYCDIIPSIDDGICEFWLRHAAYGVAEFMFSLPVKDKDEAIELAVANIPEYIPALKERCK